VAEVASTKIKTGVPHIFNPNRDRLYQATRAYISFFRSVFGSRPPGYLRWHANPEEAEILITGQSPITIETPHKRPIISVVRGQAMWASTSSSGIRDQTLLKSKKVFTDSVNSTMIINCISKESVEAQEMAWLVFMGIRVFKPTIQRFGRIFGISNQLAMGPVSAPGALVRGSSSSEWRMVQVQSPFFVQETISMQDSEDSDFHLLAKEITISMETMMNS
jgi:hypothetical protein